MAARWRFFQLGTGNRHGFTVKGDFFAAQQALHDIDRLTQSRDRFSKTVTLWFQHQR